MRKKTHEEFISDMEIKHPEIEVIGKYKTAKEHVSCKCKICNYVFNVTPDSLLNKNTGCPKCANNIRLTHQEFIERMKYINPDIDFTSEYISSNRKISCKCTKCGSVFDTYAGNLLSGHGCGKCSTIEIHNQQRKTNDEFLNRLSESPNNNVTVIGEYSGANVPIDVKCNKCGKIFKMLPWGILNGNQCGFCVGNVKKSHEEFLVRLKEINENIKVIGSYNGRHKKIEFECLKCHERWVTTPDSILCGTGCPICRESHGERKIRIWLKKYDITFESQWKTEECRNVHMLPFDFYIPKFNIIIEFDGEQHFKPSYGDDKKLKRTQLNDTIKTNFCVSHNINLIRIPYFKINEIDNILSKEFNKFLNKEND